MRIEEGGKARLMFTNQRSPSHNPNFSDLTGAMDAARLPNLCLFSPGPSPPRLSRSPASRVQRRQRASRASFVARRRQKPCLARGADTLVARSEGISQALPSDKIRAEGTDLKSWLHLHGLPPCKVDLKERPSHDGKHRSIHYVVSSEDLQEGDVAFSVPNSLIVTLDRVLGNETIAELLTTNKLSELACLALYLMYEKKQGKKSFWYPFIRELDRQRGRGQLAVESPLLCLNLN